MKFFLFMVKFNLRYGTEWYLTPYDNQVYFWYVDLLEQFYIFKFEK